MSCAALLSALLSSAALRPGTLYLSGRHPGAPPKRLTPLPPPERSVVRLQLGSERDEEPEDEDEIDGAPDEEYLDELEASLEQALTNRRQRPLPARAAFRRRRSPPPQQPERDPRSAPLEFSRELFAELKMSFDAFTEKPSQQFILGGFALLLGFYISHGQLLGGGDQGLRWEYVSSIFATFVVVRVSKQYYSRPPEQRSPTLRLLNAFNVGFMYGIVLDAIKFAG